MKRTENPYKVSWQNENESMRSLGWDEGYNARMKDEFESMKCTCPKCLGIEDPYKEEIENIKCTICGCADTADNPVIFAPDPFDREVNNDDTEYYECTTCRQNRSDEI